PAVAPPTTATTYLEGAVGMRGRSIAENRLSTVPVCRAFHGRPVRRRRTDVLARSRGPPRVPRPGLLRLRQPRRPQVLRARPGVPPERVRPPRSRGAHRRGGHPAHGVAAEPGRARAGDDGPDAAGR